MTYCLALRLEEGLVFLSDTRTNAGVDQISTFRKMTVFEHPGERLIVLLSAGNLAVTQSVRQIVCENVGPHIDTVWNAKTMFEAVRVVGEAVRTDVSATYVAKLLRPMEEFFRGAVDAGELAGPDAAFLANAFLHLARATDLAPADSTLPERLVRLFLDGAGRQG